MKPLKSRPPEEPGFRRALLREAVGCMVAGDVDTGKSVLRQYINGTIGFIQLGADLEKSPKVLMRMFSASGNPQAKNLFEIVAHLQKIDGTVLEVVERASYATKVRLGNCRLLCLDAQMCVILSGLSVRGINPKLTALEFME